MFSVTDIMTKDVITVKKDAPVLQAMLILMEWKITGMPVVDDQDNLVGILSEFDILRLLMQPEFDRHAKVEEYMSINVVSFEDTVTAVDICDFFMNNVSKRRAPITHNGKLVGLVSRSDILRLIVRVRNIV